jgi:hypothetical protein
MSKIWVVHTEGTDEYSVKVSRSFYGFPEAQRFVIDSIIKRVEDDTDRYMEWVDESEHAENLETYEEYINENKTIVIKLINHMTLVENKDGNMECSFIWDREGIWYHFTQVLLS